MEEQVPKLVKSIRISKILWIIILFCIYLIIEHGIIIVSK